jgi:hypothetical protein
VWFVFARDERHGPFTADEVFLKLNEGVFSADDHAWRLGMNAWRPLSELPFVRSPQSEAEAAAEVASSIRQTIRPSVNSLTLQQQPLLSAWGRRAARAWKLPTALIAAAALTAVLWSPAHDLLVPYEVPQLDDVFDQERSNLEKAQADRGPQAKRSWAVAISKFESLTPRFYVAGAQPDGTRVEIVLMGVPGTLIGRPGYLQRQVLTLKRGFARSEAFQSVAAGALAVGEYRVFVRTAISGPAARVLDGTALLSGQAARAGYREQAYFLGGQLNDAYRRSLAMDQEAARVERTLEIDELGQYLSEMEKVAAALRDSKSSESAWGSFQREMKNTMDAWSEASATEEFHLAPLYLGMRRAASLLETYHARIGDGSLAQRAAEAEVLSALADLKQQLFRESARQNLPH